MSKTLEQLRPFYTCHPIITSLISIPGIHADVVNPRTINLSAKAPAGRQSVPRHKTMHVTISSRLGQPSLFCFGFGVRVSVLSWTYSPLPFFKSLFAFLPSPISRKLCSYFLPQPFPASPAPILAPIRLPWMHRKSHVLITQLFPLPSLGLLWDVSDRIGRFYLCLPLPLHDYARRESRIIYLFPLPRSRLKGKLNHESISWC